jgi:hypothetical protein
MKRLLFIGFAACTLALAPARRNARRSRRFDGRAARVMAAAMGGGHHGGRGHHSGWARGRGHHYGWRHHRHW